MILFSILVGCAINRMGKDEYYVQIKMDGKEGVSKSIDGEVI